MPSNSLDQRFHAWASDRTDANLQNLLAATRRYALSIARRQGVADPEDAAQTAVLSAWRALDGFAAKHSYSAWVGQIARNRSVDAHRRVGRVARHEVASDMIQDQEAPQMDPGRDICDLPKGRARDIAAVLLNGGTLDDAAQLVGVSKRQVRRIVAAAASQN